jgi:hypothetical protein
VTDLDLAAAERVHFTDPRVRELAEARWRLISGGTREQWLALGKDNPEAMIDLAKKWIRAAVAVGILPPPGGSEPDLTVYRAEFDATTLGTYTTRRAAQDACEGDARNHGDHGPFDWIGDETESEDPWEMTAELDGEERTTGYAVVPVPVLAAYDPEAEG